MEYQLKVNFSAGNNYVDVTSGDASQAASGMPLYINSAPFYVQSLSGSRIHLTAPLAYSQTGADAQLQTEHINGRALLAGGEVSPQIAVNAINAGLAALEQVALRDGDLASEAQALSGAAGKVLDAEKGLALIKDNQNDSYSHTRYRAQLGESGSLKWTLFSKQLNRSVNTSDDKRVYRVVLATLGTGTTTGSVYLVFRRGGAWRVHETVGYMTSNHGYMFVDSDGLPKATSNHPAKYWHLIAVEEFSGETANVMPTIFGADQVISSDATSGKFFFNDMFNSGRVEAFHSGNDGGIENGSNANGSYTKFPDGTMICSGYGVGSASAMVAWTYPAAFVAFGSAQATPDTSVPRMAVMQPGLSALNFRVYEQGGIGSASGVYLMAIGRWK